MESNRMQAAPRADYLPLPERLSPEIIRRASALSAANLADGMEALGLPSGTLSAEINPVFEGMRLCGTAATVETEGGDNLPIHVAIYRCEPGYVLVIDGKSCAERAYMGDLMIGTAEAIGVEGVVIDGYVRDRHGLAALGLPVFARGFHPRSPAKSKPGTINHPIRCGGVDVCPGDLIVGDGDGVVAVPRAQIEAVLEKAEAKLRYEAKREETIEQYRRCRREGRELPEIAPDWVIEMLKSTKS